MARNRTRTPLLLALVFLATWPLLGAKCNPRGKRGDQGPRGDTGAQGDTGGSIDDRIVYGDGSAGNATLDANRTVGDFNSLVLGTARANTQYTTLTIPAGTTLTVPPGTVLRATGTVRILGTIVVQTGPRGGRNLQNSQHNLDPAHPGDSLRAAGSPNEGPGEGGVAIGRDRAEQIRVSGTIRANGAAGAVANNFAGGGGGGGWIVLASRTRVVVDVVGRIEARGGAGAAEAGGQDNNGGGGALGGNGGPASTTGAGGGGGGIVHLASPSVVVDGTIDVALGAGGGGAATNGVAGLDIRSRLDPTRRLLTD